MIFSLMMHGWWGNIFQWRSAIPFPSQAIARRSKHHSTFLYSIRSLSSNTDVFILPDYLKIFLWVMGSTRDLPPLISSDFRRSSRASVSQKSCVVQITIHDMCVIQLLQVYCNTKYNNRCHILNCAGVICALISIPNISSFSVGNRDRC